VIVDKMSEREAAKEFGLARETVRKMLRYSAPPGYWDTGTPYYKRSLFMAIRRPTLVFRPGHRLGQRTQFVAPFPSGFRSSLISDPSE
jgi:hypothetical protein